MASKRSHGRITVWRTVLVLAAAAVALLAAGAAMAASRGSSSQADRLRAIETTRLQALVDADTATARKLIAPDFQAHQPRRRRVLARRLHGRRRRRRHRLPRVRARSPIAVRLSGDSAALRYQVSFDLVVGGDTRVTHQGWITELYERRHGRWQIVWEQATAIPNNFDLFVESIKPVS